jgi:hypothetical protein
MLAQIFEHSGVSVLIGLVALYFAYRVMIQKDLKGVLGKNKPEPEDKEGFSRDTGRLLLFFAAGSFLMAVLELFNPTVALVQMAAWTVAFFALWKKINDKYF